MYSLRSPVYQLNCGPRRFANWSFLKTSSPDDITIYNFTIFATGFGVCSLNDERIFIFRNLDLMPPVGGTYF